MWAIILRKLMGGVLLFWLKKKKEKVFFSTRMVGVGVFVREVRSHSCVREWLKPVWENEDTPPPPTAATA